MVTEQILEHLATNAGDQDRKDREELIHKTKSAWLQTLTGLDHEEDDPGTSWNKDSRDRDCLLYTSPSPRDRYISRMPSSA